MNIAQRLAAGELAKDIATDTGMSETEFSRKAKQYLIEEINRLTAQLSELQTVQAKNDKLQKDLRDLQRIETEQRRTCNELRINYEQMQAAATELQNTNVQLQVAASELHTIETKRMKLATDLQSISSELQELKGSNDRLESECAVLANERVILASRVQELTSVKKMLLQRVLTSPLFLLLAIIAFEGYNGWQLFANMQVQTFPTVMAFVFSFFFGLASVTALAAAHRYGIALCIVAAFVSNAIHANLFERATFEGLFYTVLPCLLIWLFADMYRKTQN